MAGDRLVHCIIEQFGSQMVQRRLVGATDIHAGPPPYRFQSLQDLDVLGGIVGPFALVAAKQIVHAVFSYLTAAPYPVRGSPGNVSR